MDHMTHTAHQLDRHRAAALVRETELRRRAAERADMTESPTPVAATEGWLRRLTHPIRTVRAVRTAHAH